MTEAELRERFGDRVAAIVVGCTDVVFERPKPPWRERKERYLAHIATAPPDVRRVSCADKLHNARSILRDYRIHGEALWARFNAGRDGTLWYYRALADAFRKAGTGPLVDELDRVVTDLEREVERTVERARVRDTKDLPARGGPSVPEDGVAVATANVRDRKPEPAAGSRPAIPVRTIHGIDFSGAPDAGSKIWIASGHADGGTLVITACRRAATLPGSGRRRELALEALRAFLAGAGDAAIGLDFPFGVPRAVAGDVAWSDFVAGFRTRFPTADAFREAAVHAAGGKELRRVTDREAQTPFSPYNLRLYKQTYHGIRDVLGPLVRDGHIAVPPMQPAVAGRPLVLEICPAATLKELGLYVPYKGREAQHRRGRERILRTLEERGLATVAGDEVRTAVLEDAGADALDGVLAAVAVWRGVAGGLAVPVARPEYEVEGYVWV